MKAALIRGGMILSWGGELVGSSQFAVSIKPRDKSSCKLPTVNCKLRTAN